MYVRVKVYNKYEASYLDWARRNFASVTSTFDLWEERDVTEEELLRLVRNGEKVLVNP